MINLPFKLCSIYYRSCMMYTIVLLGSLLSLMAIVSLETATVCELRVSGWSAGCLIVHTVRPYNVT